MNDHDSRLSELHPQFPNILSLITIATYIGHIWEKKIYRMKFLFMIIYEVAEVFFFFKLNFIHYLFKMKGTVEKEIIRPVMYITT